MLEILVEIKVLDIISNVYIFNDLNVWVDRLLLVPEKQLLSLYLKIAQRNGAYLPTGHQIHDQSIGFIQKLFLHLAPEGRANKPQIGQTKKICDANPFKPDISPPSPQSEEHCGLSHTSKDA